MLSVLVLFFNSLVNILPDSPFQTFINGQDYSFDFLPYLNWFVPFDSCSKLLSVWASCFSAYYIYSAVKGVINRFVFDKVS